ncbi:hypothetical protein ACQ4PT_023301 [Festuca glaucescens]
MGKKKITASSSATGPKATGAAQKSSAAGKDPQCDWTGSTITKRDEKRMRSLGLISSDEKDVLFAGSDSHPNPPAGFIVMFSAFLFRGLSLPAHEFLRCLLFSYGIQLRQLTPNSILHLTIFITVCEAFLGIDPHWGPWKKIFFVKRHSGKNGPYVVGGVGFVVRKEVNYFNFPMKEFVQGWRSKWFYLRDRPASGHRSDLPEFTDVLEATPKKSWQNILTAEEKTVADKLYEKVLELKNAGGRTMIGTEVAALFLRRRIQPVMSRAHQMWLYTGAKDVTRINAADLSEKELLDEVRRLTHFSQEDTIPLVALQDPYEFRHLLAEASTIARCYPSVPETGEEPKDDESAGNIEENVEVADDSDATEDEEEKEKEKEEEEETEDAGAFIAKRRRAAVDELTDTAESSPSGQNDDDADRVLFVGAAPEASTAPPPKRSSGVFADEDELLFESDEGEIAPPPSKKAKTSSEKMVATEVEELVPPEEAPVVPLPLKRTLRKRKEAPSTAAPTTSTPKGHVKAKLEEEEQKAEAQTQAEEKEGNLRKSIETLLGAADMPVDRTSKLRVDSMSDARALLQKTKAALTRLFALVFPKLDQDKTLGQLVDAFFIDIDGTIEVTPVTPYAESSSGPSVGNESGIVQQLRSKISWMEKDLVGIHAMAAVVKKKGELATEAEEYALNKLQKATESLNFIALNALEENKRVHEKVNALTDLSQPHGVFWTSRSKAAVVAKFQDRVEQVHGFFDKCRAGLAMIWKTMFPLDPAPSTLLALMAKFRNAANVRTLV